MRRKKLLEITLCAVLTIGAAAAAETTPALGDEKSLYDLLDLDRPGMEAVKKAVAKGNVAAENAMSDCCRSCTSA